MKILTNKQYDEAIKMAKEEEVEKIYMRRELDRLEDKVCELESKVRQLEFEIRQPDSITTVYTGQMSSNG